MAGRGLQVASVMTVSRGDESDGTCRPAPTRRQSSGIANDRPHPALRHCASAVARIDVSIRVGMPDATFCAQIGVNAAGQRLASPQAATNPHRHDRSSSRPMDFRVGRYDV
jgi:hypothetical protein